MIIVTGAAGFIGSVLARRLNQEGFEDLVLVDHEKSEHSNLKKIKYKNYYDANDFLERLSSIENISFIFHIGACSSTTERNIDYLKQNNVEYSKRLFEYATNKNIPIIYASSAATYGDGENGYDDNHETIPSLKPLNPYGQSKQDFDLWALEQSQKPKHWFGLKYFNVFGPNEYHKGEMRSLVHKAYHQILDSGKVKLFKSHRNDFEDGKQLRDFVYVKDVVNAMISLMNLDLSSGSGVYNLGTGEANSFLNLVTYTFEAMGRDVNIEFIDMPESIRSQYQYFTEAKMTKFKTLVGDFEFSTLKDSVTDYVTNYLVKEDQFF